MWQQNLRQYNRMTYRKKFLCPNCNEYTLHIELDRYAECEECGPILECNINSIIKQKLYI